MQIFNIHSRGRRRAGHLLEIALYAALCAFPLVLTLLGHKGDTAKAELRVAARFPERPATLQQLAAWPRAFESYLNDQFGGRSLLIRLNSLTRWWIGDSGSHRVIVGKEGWLFLSTLDNVLDRHRGIRNFTPPQLDDWIQRYSSHQEWLHARGIQTLLVIIPDKHTIYGEFLPSRFPLMGPNPTDQLLEAMQAKGIHDVLDLRPALIASKASLQSYHKTDSHWNDQGSYLAYQAIMDTLEAKWPGLHRVEPEDIESSATNLLGGTSQLLGLGEWLREPIRLSNVADSAVVETTGGPYRQTPVHITTRHTEAPTVFLFCDSFTHASLIKYLRESFSEVDYFIHGGWSYKWFQGWAFNKKLLQREHPDVVIFAVVERLIPLPD